MVRTRIFFILGLRLLEGKYMKLKSQYQIIEQTNNTITLILLLLRDSSAVSTNQSPIEEAGLRRHLQLTL